MMDRHGTYVSCDDDGYSDAENRPHKLNLVMVMRAKPDVAIHLSVRATPLILRSIAQQCVSKDEGFQMA